MNKLQERSEIWYKLKNGQPIDLTVTMEGTGTATAKLYRDKIVVECDDAQVNKYINLSTPLAFEVINAMTIHEDANDCTVQLVNTGDAITDAISIAASDTDIDVITEIDDAYSTFQRGDDDLRLEIATDAFFGKVIIEIEPIVS